MGCWNISSCNYGFYLRRDAVSCDTVNVATPHAAAPEGRISHLAVRNAG